MEAAAWGHASMVQILLESGADLEARNKQGQTAWGLAAVGQHAEVAELFRKATRVEALPANSLCWLDDLDVQLAATERRTPPCDRGSRSGKLCEDGVRDGMVLMFRRNRRLAAVVAAQVDHRIRLGSTDDLGARDAAAGTDDACSGWTFSHKCRTSLFS